MSHASAVVVLTALIVASTACGRSPDETSVATESVNSGAPDLQALSPLVDSRALDVVSQMSRLLTEATGFALDAEEVVDEVPIDGLRHQVSNRRRVAMRRPDRLVGDVTGDTLNRTFVYDGSQLTVFDRVYGTYARLPVPPTIDEALDAAFEQAGTVIPLADFLYADSYDRMTDGVLRGTYLGIHRAAGVDCHHVAFEQETVDWELWVDAGERPLPRRLVIVYKTEDGTPRYSVTFHEWSLNPELPDQLFLLEVPDGAREVAFPVLAQADE